MHAEHQAGSAGFQEVYFVDSNRAGVTLYRLAFPGELIEPLAVFFQRRIHRWYLFAGPFESLQNGRPGVTIKLRNRGCLNDFAVGISRICCLAQPSRDAVGLVRLEKVGTDLGCLAKTERQHSRSRRVETAGVASFFGLQQALNFLQCLV